MTIEPQPGLGPALSPEAQALAVEEARRQQEQASATNDWGAIGDGIGNIIDGASAVAEGTVEVVGSVIGGIFDGLSSL